ncbi:MAG: tetratricopeptide repeat protein [Candidatus Parabeggiatoa sp.]|nr:tetratricopeptide repeat protein [Candidatus Parabeggiatoa sp.]
MTTSNQTVTIQEALELAIQYHNDGELQEAESIYRQILEVEPHQSEVLHLLGIIAAQVENYETAVELIQKAIQLDRSNVNYYNSLGNVFWYQEQFNDAGKCYRYCLTLNPDFAQAHNGFGNVLRELGYLSEALEHYQRCLALTPDFAEAHNNLGNVFREQGQSDLAIDAYQQAISLNPDYLEAHTNLGEVLNEAGQLKAALVSYQRALELNPDEAELHNHLGNTFSDLEQRLSAMAAYQKALECNPDYAEAHFNLGIVLADMGNVHQAITHYRRALEIKPRFRKAHHGLLMALNYAPGVTQAMIYAEQQRFNEHYFKPLAAEEIQAVMNPADPQRRLKIAYVSADFQKHSVAYFMEGILAHHNHEQFEIFCYYSNTVVDEVTQRFQAYADQWISCAELSDKALASLIREDQIDILIDLMGHPGNNRLAVFARKPAPVQMSYLGSPTTTGLTTIDYRITDRHLDPENDGQEWLSEIPIRLPDNLICYRPEPKSPPVNELPALKKGYITFSSLNAYYKLNSEIRALWAEVLNAVPNSKLLLKPSNSILNDPATQQAIEKQFQDVGIDSERLILEGLTAAPAYLKTYHNVDIALDSYPYNGGTTTCEALWMGIPVVTLVGETNVSRVGLSHLVSLGLNELVAYTPEAYINICVQLANDLEHLQALRSGMRDRMQASSLMDCARFTRHLEAAYRDHVKPKS